ncbi:MAG: alpha-galactosidase [Gemmatimonadota bacterium]|nr:alpha-galactosidase [Gemmatimonadota bacterium]MDH3368440.1 alpha-galactosidase [Gemmatimonadota bacterium]MDH3479286.1 alpha-galactosidase [Gemmatimonadota bacterium]MDH3570389.1 alpha-galactosidase [Gemmatimonadota bacterium]MDH5549002.1 alpha-galactosidase [Gemmatimonadota bacterium]
MKITIIGAGSREFGPATVRDLLLSERICERQPTVTLMDVAERELKLTASYARDVTKRHEKPVTIEATTELNRALDGAQVVVMAIARRRYYYWAQDFHLPRQLGFRQIYGENGGPGGLFHALRNMGPTMDIARAMERHCPDAWLLNFTNPLTKLCEGLTRLSSIKVVGLCHGVFHGIAQIAQFLECEPHELETYACGLNHFSWFQEVRDRATGTDLYPRLRERERQAHWLARWDEIALSRILFRVVGLYPSPGANHIGEYVRWAEEYLASAAIQFFHDPRDGRPWEGGEIPTWVYNLSDRPHEVPLFPERRLPRLHTNPRLAVDPAAPLEPSGEVTVPIIEGLYCGCRHEIAAVNVPNGSAIPNLPDDAVVEVPATVDAAGVAARRMQPLPELAAALLSTQISIHRLLVEAFEHESRDALLQALLLDPTTVSYRAAVDLIDLMCERQAEVLPRLEWQRGPAGRG